MSVDAGDGLAVTGAFRPVQPLLCPVVVGRDRELALLRDRVSAASAGQGGVVGLVGEAGVGKTRLCHEVTRVANEAGMRVLSGRAVPGETPVPYRPLTEALLAAFRGSAPPEAADLIGFHGQLGRLVPAWRGATADVTDESPLLLGEAVVRLLRVLGADHGCVVILEDLHWADAETLAVLDYLVDALRDEPVLGVCTSRPSGAAIDMLARAQRRDPRALIGVAALTDDDVEHVVASCLATAQPPPEVVGVVKSHSEGNPFLVEELLAGLVASNALSFEDGRWAASDQLKPAVPFSFADSIRQRLATLDPTAQRVMSAAAVLGRRFDWELLPGVAELDGRAVVGGLRRGVEEQLLEVEGSGFRFRHALTREAVLSELLPPERRDLSHRAWPAVERANPGLPGPWCELAAELAEAAGALTEAAVRLVTSASRALAAGAFTSAEATARKAISLAAGDADVTEDAEEVLVGTLALAGKPGQASAIGTELVERLAARVAPAERQAGLLIVLARAAIAAGDNDTARAMADRARALVAQGDVDEVIAARVEAVAAHVALEHADLEGADALARSAVTRAAATGQPAVECEALEVVGRVARTRNTDDARRWFDQSAAIAERHGLTSWRLRARQELALEDWANGRITPLLETRELAARHGALATVAVMDLGLADFALSAFDRDGCVEAAMRCVEPSRRYGLATLPVAELWLAGAHALTGDAVEMEAAASRALARDPDDPRILGDLWGRVRATHAILLDDRQALRLALDKQMEYARIAPVTTSIFPNRIMWALVHTIEDDDLGDAARAELAGAVNFAIWPQFGAGQEAMAAVAEGRAGRGDAAAARFTAASRSLRASHLAKGTVEYHHVLIAEAAIRDGWGEPGQWLRGAEAFFADAGYDLVARRCRSLMAKAGAPVPRRGRGDSVVPADLRAMGITSRELDVLTLVAEGLSNRAIADRLSLSPKTVERHLASLFDRTGVRNRQALSEFARSQTG
jgi:DNA-binding CsgD family transcriptional regulator